MSPVFSSRVINSRRKKHGKAVNEGFQRKVATHAVEVGIVINSLNLFLGYNML